MDEASEQFDILKVVAARLQDCVYEESGRAAHGKKGEVPEVDPPVTTDDDLEGDVEEARRLANCEAEAAGKGVERGERSASPTASVSTTDSDGTPAPGAFRMRPSNVRNSMVNSERRSITIGGPTEGEAHIEEGTQDNDLAVANPVDDPIGDLELQEAEELDAGNTSLSVQKTNQFKRNSCLASILLIVVLALAATFARIYAIDPQDESTDFASPATPDHGFASPPTTAEELVQSLLPETTLKLILDNPESARAKAYRWSLEDPFLSDYPTTRIQQRFALATLYFATNGEGWTNNEFWLDHNVHECEWYNRPDFASKDLFTSFYPGYLTEFFPPTEASPPRCNSLGLYNHLWLDQNNLVGSLPKEVYWLTSLETLSLGLNRLRGTIPPEVGQLSSLEGLVFNGHENGGSIPSELGRLSLLRSLILFDSGLQGSMPVELWRLTKLQTLSLERNAELTGSIPSAIDRIKGLRWLGLSDCLITGTIPSSIGGLTSLEWFTAVNNQLTGTLPVQLGMLTGLNYMSAAENQFEGKLPSELGELTSLALLGLWMNDFTGSVPTEFGRLTGLSEGFSLDGNSMDGTLPSELGLLSNLTTLEVYRNNFEGLIPSEFGQLSSLGLLALNDNDFSGTIPAELVALKPNLFALHVQGNSQLSGTVPEDLCILDAICIDTPIVPCEAEPGFVYDCTAAFCGCDCPC